MELPSNPLKTFAASLWTALCSCRCFVYTRGSVDLLMRNELSNEIDACPSENKFIVKDGSVGKVGDSPEVLT